MPDKPPRQKTQQEVEETINAKSETDEAALESFPASDPPGPLGQRVGPADVPEPEADDAEA